MRAIVISRPGPPDVLTLRDLPTPEPQRGEVRIAIRATAVNRADLLQRMGLYPAPPDAPADIPGLEYAGVIDALGEGVESLAPGDHVYGLAGGGTYAEYLVVPARTVVKMPADLSFTDGAAVPEAFVTAWDAMVTQGGLLAGETVLVHAVGSGVGTAAVQIARAMGARSIGTVRAGDRAEGKLRRARELGLDEGLAVGGGRFASEVLALTGGAGVELVLELVGGAHVDEDLGCTRVGGRILLVGLLAGVRAEVDLASLLRRRLRLQGTVLRARPLEEKIAASHQLARHLSPLLVRGALRPVVDRVFPLAGAAAAHAYVASNEGFGKTVLQVG